MKGKSQYIHWVQTSYMWTLYRDSARLCQHDCSRDTLYSSPICMATNRSTSPVRSQYLIPLVIAIPCAMYVTLAAPRSLVLLATALGIWNLDMEIQNPIVPQGLMVMVWLWFSSPGSHWTSHLWDYNLHLAYLYCTVITLCAMVRSVHSCTNVTTAQLSWYVQLIFCTRFGIDLKFRLWNVSPSVSLSKPWIIP